MRLKAISIVALTLFSVPAIGQEALKIDASGNVAIAGKLTTGALNATTVNAGNLDQALADLKAQNQALAAQIAQQTIDNSWFTIADSLAAGLSSVSDTDRLNNEFGVMQNNGFRLVNFSSFQGKPMLVTESFMTETKGSDVSSVKMGGVAYVPGPADFKIKVVGIAQPITVTYPCAAPSVLSFPYVYGAKGAEVVFFPFDAADNCTNPGALYARKRLFK